MTALSIVALALPDWWDSMSAVEKFSSIGGLAGLAAVIVTLCIAFDSRKSAKKQLEIAAQATATTKASVDDQIAMNRHMRSASVRLADVWVRSLTAHTAYTEREGSDIDKPKAIWGSGTHNLTDIRLADRSQVAILTLTFVNDGMAPANGVHLFPARGYPIGQEDELFVSGPEGTFLRILPGQTLDLHVAIRVTPEKYSEGEVYKVRYEDGFGAHERAFGFVIHGPAFVTDALAGPSHHDAIQGAVRNPKPSEKSKALVRWESRICRPEL